MNADKTIQTVSFRLPVGYQSFANLGNEGCYYVDKTSLIGDMIGNRRFYFLSRPRRFGKSLLVDTGRKLLRHPGENDFSAMQGQIQTLFSRIPHEWHQGGGLARYESWYASLLFTCFKALDVDVTAEDSSSHGRSGMVVHDRQVFVLEFRMLKENRTVEETLVGAIKQIRDKRHANKYRSRGESIHLIGMVFGGDDRNLVDIRVEKF